jgi:outer membrane lipoprotein-sorting protein
MLIVVFVGIAVCGRSSNGTAQSTDLNALIEGLQRKYSSMQGLEADFVQAYYGADGRTIHESGRVLLKRPGKARWEYASPERKPSSGWRNVSSTSTARRMRALVDQRNIRPQIPFLFLLKRKPAPGFRASK